MSLSVDVWFEGTKPQVDLLASFHDDEKGVNRSNLMPNRESIAWQNRSILTEMFVL